MKKRMKFYITRQSSPWKITYQQFLETIKICNRDSQRKQQNNNRNARSAKTQKENEIVGENGK